MKKKIAGLALVTLLVMAQASSVFAASSSSASTQVTTSVTKSDNGASIQTGTITVNGQTVTVTTNARGEAVVGDTALAFANGTAATAGLAETTVNQINAINSGASLAENIKDVDLTGFNALGQTMAIVTKDNATGAVNDKVSVPVSLTVPNLVADLGNVQVLFFNNATGKWELIQPVSVDPVTKQLIVNITGSGTLTVVYKK